MGGLFGSVGIKHSGVRVTLANGKYKNFRPVRHCFGLLQGCYRSEGVVAKWCNPTTTQREQSSELGSMPGKVLALKRYHKELRAQSARSDFCDPSAWC